MGDWFSDTATREKNRRRNGVCNGCRAVFGQMDAQRHKFPRVKAFHLHHEGYDHDDMFMHTIELCPSCHGIYNKEQGAYW